ncbi:MAG: acyltransferase, partial [Planctomycetia bacterium]
SVGRHVYIGPYCVIGRATIEDGALVASHVSIPDGRRQHFHDAAPEIWPRVRIGRDAWIGERAVVMADVGRRSIVGAGAVVVHPLPDDVVAVGVPARIVRFRRTGSPEFSG